MKAIFMASIVPAIDMFMPIIRHIRSECECVFLNYEGWTHKSIESVKVYAESFGTRCRLLMEGERNRDGIWGILETEKPDILVFSHEETTITGTLMVELAREMDIPTLLVPHGMISYLADRAIWRADRWYAQFFRLYLLARQAIIKFKMGRIYFLRLLRLGWYRIRNDFSNRSSLSRWDRYSYIAAYGDSMKEILIKYGAKPESIVVTGNPKFDAICQRRNNASKKEVLLLTDYMVEFGLWSSRKRRDFVLDVYRAVESLPEYKLVIKIHPVMENLRSYRAIIDGLPNPPRLYQKENVADLIADCAVAITVLSSTGLEAMVAGKPLVVYNPYHDVTHYKESDGIYFAYMENGLASVLRELASEGISDYKRKLMDEFIYRQAYIQDGKSAERIGNLIIKMAIRQVV